MNLILLKPDELKPDCERIRLTDRRFQHIRDVLKTVPGEPLRVGVLGGARYTARLENIGTDSCEIALVAESPTLPRPNIDVLLALPRPKCLKRLLPQASALGIGRLYITGAEKVEKNYWGSRFLLPELYRPLLEEGLEQAADTIPPEIIVARRLKPLLEDVITPRYADSCKLLAHPGEKSSSQIHSSACAPTIIAIGPEGGWTEYELTMFERAGFIRYSLGPRILRADTAVIALVSSIRA